MIQVLDKYLKLEYIIYIYSAEYETIECLVNIIKNCHLNVRNHVCYNLFNFKQQ